MGKHNAYVDDDSGNLICGKEKDNMQVIYDFMSATILGQLSSVALNYN